MTEREEFEAWAKKPPREWELTRHGQSGAWPGQYRYHVQCAWEAWLAATAKERAKHIDDAGVAL